MQLTNEFEPIRDCAKEMGFMKIEHKITHSIIANQLALNHNESLKHTSIYKQALKNKLNNLLSELVKYEKDYDEFFNKVEDSTCEVYNIYDNYIKAIASIPIYDAQNIITIINAYKKDSKSIEGICRKILK